MASAFSECDWLEARFPSPMLIGLKQLDAPRFKRRFRLYGCGCCRLIWDLIHDRRQRAIVDLVEKHADEGRNSSGIAEYRKSLKALPFVGQEYVTNAIRGVVSHEAFYSAFDTWSSAVRARLCMIYPHQLELQSEHYVAESLKYCRLVYEIFGNPFRPVTLDPRWLSSTVLDLARTIYDERAFERLPILADALMDAGCDSDEIINHCHSEGPHVRGCWVVDLVLGRE